MAKKVAQSVIARPAAVLQPYDITLIRRRLQLHALEFRVAKLLKKLNEKLGPHIEAELHIDGPDCTKTVVEVGAAPSLVEVGRTDRTQILYRKILEKHVAPDVVAEDAKDPDFTTTSSSYRAKLLGKELSIESLLNS